MDENIGVTLGVRLALLEERHCEDGEDLGTLKRIELISSTYRNFTVAGFDGFKDAFQHGYALGKRDMDDSINLDDENDQTIPGLDAPSP